MKKISFFFLLFFLFLNTTLFSQINLLSGSSSSTFDSIAKDIKAISNQDVIIYNSLGETHNYKDLVSDGIINISFIQYDILLANKLLDPKYDMDLKMLTPLFFDQNILLITRKNSGIKKIKDLKNKNVGVGTIDEATFISARTIKARIGLKWKDIEMTAKEAVKALKEEKIDAFFYVCDSSDELLKSDDCKDFKLIPIRHKNLKGIYSKKKIKKSAYYWQKKAVATQSVSTIMLVNIKKNEGNNKQIFLQLKNDILNNLDELKAFGHPIWLEVYKKNSKVDISCYCP